MQFFPTHNMTLSKMLKKIMQFSYHDAKKQSFRQFKEGIAKFPGHTQLNLWKGLLSCQDKIL